MNKRRAARFGAIQALYQAEISGQDIETIVNEFRAYRLSDLFEPLELDEPAPEVDQDWFVRLAKGTYDEIGPLDATLERTLSSGWTLARLGYLLRAFLRAGAFELLQLRDEVPVRVVMNEYVELAHAFLTKEDAGFLNAVLDRLAAGPHADTPPGPLSAET